jgi:hypothetical protein
MQENELSIPQLVPLLSAHSTTFLGSTAGRQIHHHALSRQLSTLFQMFFPRHAGCEAEQEMKYSSIFFFFNQRLLLQISNTLLFSLFLTVYR